MKSHNINNYEKESFLGCSNFSLNYRVRNLVNNTKENLRIFDKKHFSSKQGLFHHFQKEKNFLIEKNEKNLLNIKDYFEDQQNCYIIYEDCSNSNFLSYLNQQDFISEKEAIFYLIEIIKGYNIYKKENFSQRDFTIENILLDKNTIKIDDLGLSMFLAEKDNFNMFKSPEQFFNNSFIPNKSDVWSLGMIYFYILFKQLPWKAPTETSFFRLVKLVDMKIPKNKIIEGLNADFLHKMLEKDHKKRINWDDILKHQLFQGIFEKMQQNNYRIPNFKKNKTFLNMFSDSFQSDLLKNLEEIHNENTKVNLIKFSEIEFVKDKSKLNDKKPSLINFSDEDENENEKKIEIPPKSIENLLDKLKNSQKTKIGKTLNDKKEKQKQLKDINKLLNEEIVAPIEKVSQSLKSSLMESKRIIISFSNEPLEEFIYSSNYPKLIRNDEILEINSQKDFECLKKIINNKLLQINVLGNCAAKTHKLMKGTEQMEFWKIYCFFLVKKMLCFRSQLLNLLKDKKNNFTQNINEKIWNSFQKTSDYFEICHKIEDDNQIIQKNFERIYEEINFKLKYFEKNEIDCVKEYINKDLKQNFNRVFFIMLLLYSQALDKKIAKEKNPEKLCFLIQVKLEIYHSMIMSELNMAEENYEEMNAYIFNIESLSEQKDIENLKLLMKIKSEQIQILKQLYIR